MVILRVLIGLALLPVVAGISFEIIKLPEEVKANGWHGFSKPGIVATKLDHKRTRRSQIEVAIESMKRIPENKEDDRWYYRNL